MHEMELTKKGHAGERAEAEHPARRLGVLDLMVLVFTAFTLVLMPILVGGPDAGDAQSKGGSFSAQERRALADSKGDAAAGAAAENAAANAADGSGSAAPMVRGADGQPVDDQTRQAIDEASRGDAAAQGSVGSDYNRGGGRY